MLLGKKSVAVAPEGVKAESSVFDVSGEDFEARVLKASMDRPVLVDFWAPWCGPCKQLMPVLEEAVRTFGGEVLLAKVNIDKNQELAAALRIQSVPTVYAFFQGRPIDAFQGVIPPSQIKSFIAGAIKVARQAQPDAIDIPEGLKIAALALAEKNVTAAHGIYSQILSQDMQNVQAYVGLVRTFIAAGKLEKAQELLDSAPAEISSKPMFAEARSAVDLAGAYPKGSVDDFSAQLLSNPKDYQARLNLACAQFSAGRKEEAIDNLFEILESDRMWNEEAARKQLLKFFEALGHADPLTVAARRKLSTLLFS